MITMVVNDDRIRRLEPNELRVIYKEHIREDFPRGERRPLFAMERLQKVAQYVCYGYYRNDILIAYACYILTQTASYALLDYFAVIPELRGRGIGSDFLRSLRGKVPAECGVFIEVESPGTAKSENEKQARERRINFYLSNGAEMTSSKCLLFGVDYDILFIPANNADCATEETERHRTVEELYRAMYGRAYGRLCKPYYERNAEHAPI